MLPLIEGTCYVSWMLRAQCFVKFSIKRRDYLVCIRDLCREALSSCRYLGGRKKLQLLVFIHISQSFGLEEGFAISVDLRQWAFGHCCAHFKNTYSHNTWSAPHKDHRDCLSISVNLPACLPACPPACLPACLSPFVSLSLFLFGCGCLGNVFNPSRSLQKAKTVSFSLFWGPKSL